MYIYIYKHIHVYVYISVDTPVFFFRCVAGGLVPSTLSETLGFTATAISAVNITVRISIYLYIFGYIYMGIYRYICISPPPQSPRSTLRCVNDLIFL